MPWSKFEVLLPMGGKTNQVAYGCLGRSLKSDYLRVEGLTKPPASALVQNLSPFTYRWKDEPSHSRVSWSKLKSYYLLVEGRTKPPASALVQNLSPSTYRWKVEPSHSRVSWSKFKSSYLRVERRTKSPTGALVEV